MQRGGDNYRELGMRYADSQWETPEELKPEQKAFADKGYSWQTRVWIDDMFMITTVQSQAYRTTGNLKYIDRAAREMVMYLNEIQCPNGLFYHSPQAPFFWARGNGWMAAGMAELLSCSRKTTRPSGNHGGISQNDGHAQEISRQRGTMATAHR